MLFWFKYILYIYTRSLTIAIPFNKACALHLHTYTFNQHGHSQCTLNKIKQIFFWVIFFSVFSLSLSHSHSASPRSFTLFLELLCYYCWYHASSYSYFMWTMCKMREGERKRCFFIVIVVVNLADNSEAEAMKIYFFSSFF